MLNVTEYCWMLLNIQLRELLNIQLMKVSLTVLTASEYTKNIRLLRFNRPPDDITYIDNSNLSDSYYVE